MDIEVDVFAEHDYGKLALEKLAPVSEDFRLYSAEWLGDRPEDWDVMRITGAQFRRAKRGPNKGKLSIMVPGTSRTAHVTKKEILEYAQRKTEPTPSGSRRSGRSATSH